MWQFDCWVDADFAGNWRQCDAHVDPMTSKSRSGWLVRFAGAPITWASKMQTITAMSTTEAKYIALSTSLREVIPMMGMLQEAREHGLQADYLPPKVHCTVFEDNSGALELARLPKIWPRTKHINQSYHHFREHVDRQDVTIQATPTEAQLADILTKPLPGHYGMVGCTVCERKGVFKYPPRKGCKIQIVTASRLCTVLDMRPSTSNNPTSNQDPNFTALPTPTLLWVPYSNPN